MLSLLMQYLSLAILGGIALWCLIEMARACRRYRADRLADDLRMQKLIQEVEICRQQAARSLVDPETPRATGDEPDPANQPRPSAQPSTAPNANPTIAAASAIAAAVTDKPTSPRKNAAVPQTQQLRTPVAWQGTRKLRVVSKITECDGCHSIYLMPHDGQPLPLYLPGQYLTFSIPLPGQVKPVLRCYSLSDEPSTECYRCTIKKVPPPESATDAPPGAISSYLNDVLQVGDVLDVRAPRGSFFLDVFSELPVVLIAGGIGITPLLSMLNTLLAARYASPIYLFYGVRNSEQHPFRRHLTRLAEQFSNFSLQVAYSRPLAQDQQPRDFHVSGRIDADFVRRVVNSFEADFYVCGPSSFMESNITGLLEWGVDASRIRYEAFGPSSFGETVQAALHPTAFSAAHEPPVEVAFQKTGKSVLWDGSDSSLLELAERHGITLAAGCRAGNCGTCLTTICKGSVAYAEFADADHEQGQCLPCVCVPTEPLVLDA